MKKIFILLIVLVVSAAGLYFLTQGSGKTERAIYYDREIQVGFVKVANDKLLGSERLEFEKLNNETGPDQEYKKVRLFTEDFRDADFTSSGVCAEEKIENGGYEIYVTSDIDQTVNQEYTLENIDWESKISRAEGAPGTEEVKMIEVQGYPFLYHRTNDGDCWNFVKIEGWINPSHKLAVSIHYYRDNALEDFDDFVNSLEFLNVK